MATKKVSVTSEDINKPKPAAKKAAVKKQITEDDVSNNGKILIVFESGAGYTTGSGFHFSQRNKMAALPVDEANLLLALDNFRLPSDEEKEMHYNNQED